MKMKELQEETLDIQNRNYIPGDTMRVGGDSLPAPVQLTCLALTFMLSIFFFTKNTKSLTGSL